MAANLFTVAGMGISIRDLVLIVGLGRVRLCDRPDRGDRHRVLAGLGDHRCRHRRPHPGDGGRHPAVGAGDAAGRQPAGPLHRRQPDRENAGPGLHPDDRCGADPGRPGRARAQALHLRRDGLLGAGGVAEPADAPPRPRTQRAGRRQLVPASTCESGSTVFSRGEA
uniref:Uncharacterized protein n=1 Tax=Panagrolaimus superbus TaxID=310955 RepID=A0A914YVA6_9BILA